jgi:hypothetical protein
MNIFLLDLDPKKAAQAHADKHVVKMLLEACQLLYTAHWAFTYPKLLECKAPIHLAKAQKALPVPETMESAPTSLTRPDEPGFRPCHIHHPCAKWVRESIDNYDFTANLAIELAKEFTYRYPKKGAHECEKHAHWLKWNPPMEIPCIPLTPFVLAMDNQYKKEDPVDAYRHYYLTAKKEKGLLEYKFRPAPLWVSACQIIQD